MRDPDQVQTLVPCPACEACLMCEGTGKVTCYRCHPQRPHRMDCPADTTCGVCQGVGMCSATRRTEWLRLNPPTEMAR